MFDFARGQTPPEVPGEGPDCHFPEEVKGFGPVPARIRGGQRMCLIFILALSAAGEQERKQRDG